MIQVVVTKFGNNNNIYNVSKITICFIIVILIGGLEWSSFGGMDLLRMLLVIFLLLCLHYELFFNYRKAKIQKEIKDKTEQRLILSNFSRIENLVPWFIYSRNSSLFLLFIGLFYNECLNPGIRYCNNLYEEFQLVLLLIILISIPTILLIGYFFYKKSLKEKFYLLSSLITLRVILIEIILCFLSGYNSELSEHLVKILSIGILGAICELGIVDNLLIYIKSLININISLNLYEIWDKILKCLIDYRAINFKYRMASISCRWPLINKPAAPIKVLSQKLTDSFFFKFLKCGYYPSHFQSLPFQSLPWMSLIPFMVEHKWNRILESPAVWAVYQHEWNGILLGGSPGGVNEAYIMPQIIRTRLLEPQPEPPVTITIKPLGEWFNKMGTNYEQLPSALGQQWNLPVPYRLAYAIDIALRRQNAGVESEELFCIKEGMSIRNYPIYYILPLDGVRFSTNPYSTEVSIFTQITDERIFFGNNPEFPRNQILTGNIKDIRTSFAYTGEFTFPLYQAQPELQVLTQSNTYTMYDPTIRQHEKKSLYFVNNDEKHLLGYTKEFMALSPRKFSGWAAEAQRAELHWGGSYNYLK